MHDPSAAHAMYRTTEVSSSGPVAQVVLLYQGAIRFGVQHVAALERGDLEAAHQASVRCQAIVAGLREILDPSAGLIADHLDQLYAFILRRLVEGNVRKQARPTSDAIDLLRSLLPAWQEVARSPGGRSARLASALAPALVMASVAPAQALVVGPGR